MDLAHQLFILIERPCLILYHESLINHQQQNINLLQGYILIIDSLSLVFSRIKEYSKTFQFIFSFYRFGLFLHFQKLTL
jgi:hypothetical protein